MYWPWGSWSWNAGLHWQGVELRGLADLGHVGWLLVPMLVGAAGNLINDYFDVREDRISKPEKALVGRTVKRRVVMVTHWGFTVAALVWSALAVDRGSLPVAFRVHGRVCPWCCPSTLPC